MGESYRGDTNSDIEIRAMGCRSDTILTLSERGQSEGIHTFICEIVFFAIRLKSAWFSFDSFYLIYIPLQCHLVSFL